MEHLPETFSIEIGNRRIEFTCTGASRDWYGSPQDVLAFDFNDSHYGVAATVWATQSGYSVTCFRVTYPTRQPEQAVDLVSASGRRYFGVTVASGPSLTEAVTEAVAPWFQ